MSPYTNLAPAPLRVSSAVPCHTIASTVALASPSQRTSHALRSQRSLSYEWRARTAPCTWHRNRSRCTGVVAGTGRPGQGDLYGGSDEERNKAVNDLRALFAQSAPSEDTPAPEQLAEPLASSAQEQSAGLWRDVPLCRWSFCVLPHHQAGLNVWQPQYTLMFDRLLAQPPPHYYLHLYTPGGAASLADPQYALEPGTRAPLAGTLMRVVHARRERDGRLIMVAQGLGRAEVVRATQALPYARGDIQLLPDLELLTQCARSARALLAHRTAAGADPASQALTEQDRRRRLRQMLLAGAVAEDAAYYEYEACRAAARVASEVRPLCQLDPGAAAGAVALAAAERARAMAEVLRRWADAPPPPAADAPSGLQVNKAIELALEGSLPAGSSGVEKEEKEEEETIRRLETQVWVELDYVLRTLKRVAGGEVPVPSQMLGLLPPAPAAGWPAAFVATSDVVDRLRRQYDEIMGSYGVAEDAGSMTGVPPDQSDRVIGSLNFVPVDPAYPLTRRAWRLSYVIWAVIGQWGDASVTQGLLDALSTADRLRSVLLRLRNVAHQLEG